MEGALWGLDVFGETVELVAVALDIVEGVHYHYSLWRDTYITYIYVFYFSLFSAPTYIPEFRQRSVLDLREERNIFSSLADE